ncbi:hypothetical protein KUCAC02_000479, partial [Chaenocephalus aceratus]
THTDSSAKWKPRRGDRDAVLAAVRVRMSDNQGCCNQPVITRAEYVVNVPDKLRGHFQLVENHPSIILLRSLALCGE